MSSTSKIKKAATVLLGVVGAVFLWFVIQQVRSITFNTEVDGWSAFTVVSNIVHAVVILAALGIGASLLYSIRKDETPFNLKNISKLKVIAILLILFEPYVFFSTWLIGRFHPLIIGDTTISVRFSLGGIILVSGFVVYCVALVFEYGISLQNQVDETL